MLIVPIQKDVILTNDNKKLRVIEYTNYKDGGPAVYARTANKDVVLVYFFDIAEINGTKVEYQRGSRIFRALGKVSREQHLPQPDDNVVVLKSSISDDQESKNTVEVAGLKLKSKALGVNKGMFIKDAEGNAFRLSQIHHIDKSLGTDNFDKSAFTAIYKDYMGV